MKHVLQAIGASLVLTLVFSLGYVLVEPVIAAAVTDSVVISLQVDAQISITSPADTFMSRSLNVSDHTAVATTTWNVKTNNSTGYTLALAASTYPAMKSGSDSVTDYATTTSPSTWSVTSGDARFGFSVIGNDIRNGTTYWGTGNYCTGASTSTISTTKKYTGFSVAGTTTASRTSTTTPSGVDTTVCYAVEQNGFYIPSGTYTATITATALTQ